MVWRTLTNELSITYQTVPALTILGYCLAKSAGQDEKTESNWQKKNSKQSSHSSTPSSYHWKSSSLGMLAGSLIPININQKRHGFVFPIAKTCLATWLLVCFLSRFFFALIHPPARTGPRGKRSFVVDFFWYPGLACSFEDDKWAWGLGFMSLRFLSPSTSSAVAVVFHRTVWQDIKINCTRICL